MIVQLFSVIGKRENEYKNYCYASSLDAPHPLSQFLWVQLHPLLLRTLVFVIDLIHFGLPTELVEGGLLFPLYWLSGTSNLSMLIMCRNVTVFV